MTLVTYVCSSCGRTLEALPNAIVTCPCGTNMTPNKTPAKRHVQKPLQAANKFRRYWSIDALFSMPQNRLWRGGIRMKLQKNSHTLRIPSLPPKGGQGGLQTKIVSKGSGRLQVKSLCRPCRATYPRSFAGRTEAHRRPNPKKCSHPPFPL